MLLLLALKPAENSQTSLTSFEIAVKDGTSDSGLIIGRVGNGFTDEDLHSLTNRCRGKFLLGILKRAI